MSHIPADLNQTMWDIADRRDDRAASDFCEKFPGLADDMRSRMHLVGGMKGIRQAITPAFVPNFRPQYLPTSKWKFRRLAPAALALAAIAGASYYVTQNMLTPLPDPSTLGGPRPFKEPQTRDVRLPKTATPRVKQDYESDAPKPFTKARAEDPRPVVEEPVVPVRIQLQQVHLQNAITGIAQRFDHKVQFPENFPNPIIDVDLTGTNAMNFLNQLGNQYGFTAFDEADGNIYLLLPSADQHTTGP